MSFSRDAAQACENRHINVEPTGNGGLEEASPSGVWDSPHHDADKTRKTIDREDE